MCLNGYNECHGLCLKIVLDKVTWNVAYKACMEEGERYNKPSLLFMPLNEADNNCSKDFVSKNFDLENLKHGECMLNSNKCLLHNILVQVLENEYSHTCI